MADSGDAQNLCQEDLLQAHRKERKDLQGAWEPLEYHLTPEQFECCFHKLQRVPYTLNNIPFPHLREFLSSSSLKYGIGEDAILLSLLTCTAHFMGVSASRLQLTESWSEYPVLWSTVLLPQVLSCHSFASTLQTILIEVHQELSSRHPSMSPTVLDFFTEADLFPLLEAQSSPAIGVHSTFRLVRALLDEIGDVKLRKIASGEPILYVSEMRHVFLNPAQFNICSVIEPWDFHETFNDLSQSQKFNEWFWPCGLLGCSSEKYVEMCVTEDVNERSHFKELMLAVAETHLRVPIVYRLTSEARAILPHLTSTLRQLALSWNMRLPLFKTALSQILRTATILNVLDSLLRSSAISREVSVAYLWQAHEVVMHSLRMKAELLNHPIADETLRQGTNGGPYDFTSHRTSVSTPEQTVAVLRASLPHDLSVSVVQAMNREDEVNHSMMVAAPPEFVENCPPTFSILPESDEEFINQFRYKIRRLLLCGKSILTPTLISQMKYIPVADPSVPGKPRYPTHVAAMFLERVAALGFGMMIAPSDSHSKRLVFHKVEYHNLGPQQLDLLQNLRITREQYSQGCQRMRAAPYTVEVKGANVPTACVAIPLIEKQDDVIDVS
ncbi:uncharacterized protein LOC135378327 isoform X1 [Ornithodoros turicata]|uniref:uncharacterized protein LOC135378327 isoform X1 n=1 Tax=Ornithodoros turicata TaxID=34597 RepID=UPI003139BF5B